MFFRIFILAAALWCAAPLAAAEPARVKVGFFVDNGSRGSGVLYWARLLHYSPQLEVTLLDGKDIRDGKLDGLDLLMVPGGASGTQCRMMGEEGKAALRRFVASGGSYLGVCAGYHCTLNRPERISLFPYTISPEHYGGMAPLAMELSEKGAKLLDIPAGRYVVRYSHGPIAVPAPLKGGGEAEVLGVYRAFVGPAGRPGRNFFGKPAILYGNYGKGKVIATSFHPESREGTYCIALGCIYAVTGVKPTPLFPVRSYRPIRVGYCSSAIAGKRCIREVLELDRDREIDLRFVDIEALEVGELSHLDVMIFSAGVEASYKKVMTPRRIAAVKEFMDRGGRVLASGNGAAFLPAHPHLRTLPVGGSFTTAAKLPPDLPAAEKQSAN